MSPDRFVGVDIGGTHLRAALVDGEGRISRRIRVLVEGAAGPEAVFDRLKTSCLDLIRQAQAVREQVLAVGLAVAGKIDRAAGRVLFSPNLPTLNGYPLARKLEEALQLPVAMENDANMFGIGEAWKGAAQGIRNWIGVTLGTGVGGCLFLAGRLWTGDGLGFEGEIGHMVLDPAGPVCACGLRGCLEAHASGSALCTGVHTAIRSGTLTTGRLFDLAQSDRLTPQAVFQCAQSGNAHAVRLFERMGWALGLALANLFTLLGIRHAVIGGGVSDAWEQFIEPLKEGLARHSSMLDPSTAVILRRQLQDDGALIGAGRLAFLTLNP